MDVYDPANIVRDIYADKDYIDGGAGRLDNEYWRMHLQPKGIKGKPLSAARKWRNRRIAKPRVCAEHIFAGGVQIGCRCCAGAA
ncbi:hypothetical protein [Pseudoduganella namucuonensis]|uniref:hypothetical protein n=1 Tax=Pseudoduganella namucuonensis TaxID=1035707 RepID=UPI001160994D|nr:hypothetical protein [Pseudoduganella namucuonensis]